jgi:hypothetical protein
MPCYTPDPDHDYKNDYLEKDLFFKLHSFLNIPAPEEKNITSKLCEACRNIDVNDLKKIISDYYKSYSSEKIDLYCFYRHHLLKDLNYNAAIGDFEHAQLTLKELIRIEGS